MSLPIMKLCWPLQMPPTAKSVLISLANFADDDGHCWPSIELLSEQTCASRRSVIDAIKWLEASGVVSADRSNGRHTKYYVFPERFVAPQIKSLRSENRKTSANSADQPVQIRHEPVQIRQMYPSQIEPTSADSAESLTEFALVPVQIRHEPVQMPHTNPQEPPLEPPKEPPREPSGTIKGSGSSTLATTPDAKRGSRLPKDWVLPKDLGEWSLAEFPAWSVEMVQIEGQKFRDYWVAKPGKDATKLDWPATWRNWCRNARVTIGSRVLRPSGPMSDADRETANDIAIAEAKQKLFGKPGRLTDEQRNAINAAETQKAKDLYRQRYGGGDVIDAETMLVEPGCQSDIFGVLPRTGQQALAQGRQPIAEPWAASKQALGRSRSKHSGFEQQNYQDGINEDGSIAA